MARARGKEMKAHYDAARLFVDHVLRRRDSLFTPGLAVWSEATLEDLHDRLVKHPDTSADSFDTKLQRQLTGAAPDTLQLGGELLYVHLLPGGSTSGATKRSLINKVLGWSPAPAAIPAELDQTLDRGLAAEGLGFRVHRPFLLQYLLEFVREWWRRDETARSRALADPWAFKEVAFSVRVPRSRTQAEMLLHLVHPDSFEHIMSRAHKLRIAQAFDSLAGEPTDDVDRKLLQIRRKLAEQEGREIDFYEPRFLVVWQPEADPWGQFVHFAGLFHRLPRFDEWERDYKLRLAEGARPAIQASINRADDAVGRLHAVLRSKDQNIVRWQDYDPFIAWCRSSPQAAHRAVSQVLDTDKPPVERVRAFAEAVPRDVVKSPASRTTLASFFLFASDPHNLILFRARPFEWAFGQVDYPPAPDRGDEARRYEHALGFCERLVNEAAQRGLKLRDRLDAQGVIWAMAMWPGEPPEGMSQPDWDEFTRYRGGALVRHGGDDQEDGDTRKAAGDTGPLQAARLVEGDPIGRLVLRRKNVVLYGPPGTGKTHASLALAEKWRRSYGDGSVLQLTFHPTFAYEDFIEGFRPDPTGRFERRDGIFVQACDRAHAQADRPMLLLIDELNRGDVARLFGELITLIEPDKRHSGVSRKLPYSQRELWVPPNLHLLGTMNTADRSISLLDVAIRRRFCFVEYRPDPLAIASSAAHHKAVAGVPLADLMVAINRRLLCVGVDRDRAVGHSHFLVALSEAHPLEALRDRFRYDILPLVEEYCYADRALLRQVFDRLVTDDGSTDEEVLNDDGEFADALGAIVKGAEGGAAITAGGDEE